MDQPIAIAKVGRFRGVHGEVYIHPYIDLAEEELLGVHALLRWPDGKETRTEIERIQPHSSRTICKLDYSSDMDTARSMVHAEIIVDRSALQTAGEDEYFAEDLEGLAVQTVAGEAIGTVDKLLDYGAHVVLQVAGKSEILIPFTGEIVVDIDLESGLVIVDPPEGLLEINED